jgi:hypothetical protein
MARNIPAYRARGNRNVSGMWGRSQGKKSLLGSDEDTGATPLTNALRVIPLLQSGFHEHQQLLWKQMKDRQGIHAVTHASYPSLSPRRTSNHDPIRPAVFLSCETSAKKASPPYPLFDKDWGCLFKDKEMPQHFYETGPLLTRVTHSPRELSGRAARSASARGTPRQLSAREISPTVEAALSQRGMFALQREVYGPPSISNQYDYLRATQQRKSERKMRPTSAPIVRKPIVRKTGERPWSAHAATRVSVGMEPPVQDPLLAERLLQDPPLGPPSARTDLYAKHGSPHPNTPPLSALKPFDSSKGLLEDDQTATAMADDDDVVPMLPTRRHDAAISRPQSGNAYRCASGGASRQRPFSGRTYVSEHGLSKRAGTVSPIAHRYTSIGNHSEK